MGPFDLFDFNRDGEVDRRELALGFEMMEEWEKEDDDWDDDEEDDY